MKLLGGGFWSFTSNEYLILILTIRSAELLLLAGVVGSVVVVESGHRRHRLPGHSGGREGPERQLRPKRSYFSSLSHEIPPQAHKGTCSSRHACQPKRRSSPLSQHSTAQHTAAQQHSSTVAKQQSSTAQQHSTAAAQHSCCCWLVLLVCLVLLRACTVATVYRRLP